MRAVFIDDYGSPDVVKIGDRPEPEPDPGEVRIRLAAAGYNHVDLYMRAGGIGITHELPLTLGVDGAGVIDAVGAGVSRWQTGERVVLYPILYCGRCEFCLRGDQMLCTSCKIFGEHIDGNFAEFICVPEAIPHRIADDRSFEAAAVLPCALLTAWRMITTLGQVQSTDSLLVHGIGGGVSLACLQFARLLGATVFVTSSSGEKLERARELGAAAGINYREQDVFKEVMRLTDGRGVDVVIENVGKATWSTSLKCLVRGGRIINNGATTGGDASADLQRVFIRQLKIFGSTLGNQEEFRSMVQAFNDHKFEPVIDRVYPLDEASLGLERMEQGLQFGKIALRISE
ncbi:MAG: zinc-binding dehydrogenase [Alphaproteobacteria bacterium]|nr:zinc-binding dehydrogenase [Alphaproteobacteria bacterium]